MNKDRHRFIPNILKLSQSDDTEEALKEWYPYPLNEKANPPRSLQCACNAWITHTHTFINNKTGHAILLGTTCKNNLNKITLKKGKYNNDDFVHGERVTYTNISDMDEYSVKILQQILADIRRRVQSTFKLEILINYKNMISTFAIDTSEVVQLINDKIQNCQAEIERERLERERQEQVRQQYLQRQREIAAEQQRIMQEAARVAAEQEIDRKRQEAARKLFEKQRENARKEAEKEQQRIRDAERRAEQAALDLIREEKRRVERIEREKKEAVERERIRIKQQQIAEERKKELNEQFDFYCKCKNAVYKKYNPHSDELRCKNCKKIQPNV